MDHSYKVHYNNIELRSIQKNDIENLRIWRNDDTQTQYLRKIPYITPEMQKRWYQEYLKDTNILGFSIIETLKLKRMVGSLSLYNFQGKTAEIGKIQIGDPAARGQGIGGVSFVMAMKLGFEKLGLEKIVASVHRENIAAYKSYKKIGFRLIGSHPAFVEGVEDELEIDYARLKDINKYIADIVFIDNGK